MATQRDRRFLRAALLLFSCFTVISPVAAQHISLRLQVGNRSSSVNGYERAGLTYVSIRDFAVALSYPCVNNAERRKIELRLPNHRVKATAQNPFLVITDVSTSTSSVVQLPETVFFLDSLYYAPASNFVAVLERLTPTGILLTEESRVIAQEPAATASRFDITGFGIETRSNGYLLTIKTTRKLGYFDTILRNGWLYVTVDAALADTVALGNVKTNDIIRKIVVFQYPASVQLTFQVSPDIAQADPIIDNQSENLLVALHTKSAMDKAEIERKEREAKQDSLRDKLQGQRGRAKLDVIVIDAGHGGKDPGTIGVTGTREKDVALGVALKLGKLIEQNLKDVKVVYTRSTDTFVELDERGRIANDANGKLFISIHCNSTERKPSSANGFEIYLLRPGKTQNAIDVATQENKAIEFEANKERYEKLTEEFFILLTMRQSAFARYSEEFAAVASDIMAQELKIQNSGVKQAGFYVLVGASMPNVLVETGYLSNRAEEKVLRSQDGQKRMAEALFKGIVSYKSIYEKGLQEGRQADPEGN
jgi:N-acetylmuramoyl-L-alanine amidase